MSYRPIILIAEDDELHVKILLKHFQKGNFQVDFARNGAEGLEKAKALQPDLVISDWMMPEMSGAEFCKALKASTDLKFTYFILLTAKSQIEDLVMGLEFGADDFLTKPYNPKELMARVRTGLRIVALQRENARLQRIETINQTAITTNHEINNPLQAIVSSAELILNECPDSEIQMKERINIILENAGRIRTVTKKLENMIEVSSKEYTAGGPEMIDINLSTVKPHKP